MNTLKLESAQETNPSPDLTSSGTTIAAIAATTGAETHAALVTWDGLKKAFHEGQIDPIGYIFDNMPFVRSKNLPREQLVTVDDAENVLFTCEDAWQIVKLFWSLEREGEVRLHDLSSGVLIHQPLLAKILSHPANAHLFELYEQEKKGEKVQMVKRRGE